ncbi:DUF4412 domain-containing protein [Mesonia sp. HuA40]|uniref:DUF4412 domain-containing protein n=1 Tax=Mesonia sp. HuA40 TaxID=2602761 RepID=UPI0011C88997|nr:DUF4412 domain-containing protein [Mesonia sp. HuA40]TXK72732.1 DUF4412 domain-containing protein [Mesonia sp. HuA40]
MDARMKYVLIAFSFLIGLSPCEAQIFKKLKKRVEQKAEQVIIDKSADKAAKGVESGMDDILSAPENIRVKSSKIAPKEHYHFDYTYVLEMQSQKQQIKMTYFLNTDNQYMGIKLQDAGADMFMVIDAQKNTQFSFIQAGNQKIVQAMQVDLEEDTWEDESDYQFSELPSKKILGYQCKGKRYTNDEYQIDLYFTQEVPVKMIYQQNQNLKNFPEGFDPNENGLVLLMDFKHHNKSKRNMRMRCISLEKEPFSFSTAGYQQF